MRGSKSLYVWEASIDHIDEYLEDVIKPADEANATTRLILLVGAINTCKMMTADTGLIIILDSILEAGGFKVDDQQ